MRPYEIMLILDSAVEEVTVDSAVSRIRDALPSKSGQVGQVEKWGRRRLAYEMNHRKEGYYALVQLDAEPASVAAIDRVLSLADEVVRHKIIRLPDSLAGKLKSASNNGVAGSAAPVTTGA